MSAVIAKLPPRPSMRPFIQMARYMRAPTRLFDACRAEVGDTFLLDLGGRPWTFVSSPSAVKELYAATNHVLSAGKAKAHVFAPIVGTTSSLVLDGEAHLARRRLLLPSFRGDSLAAFAPMILAQTNAALEHWEPNQVFTSHERLQAVVLEAVVASIFGEASSKHAELTRKLEQMIARVVGSRLLFWPKLQVNLGRWSPWGQITAIMKDVDRLLLEDVTHAPLEGHGLLSMLLQVRDESGNAMTPTQLRDELVTMVVAGSEITGISLAWALYAFLSNPRVIARIEQELDDVVGLGRVPEPAQLDKLVYLDAAIKESLRLHPAVVSGSVRIVEKPFEIDGYALPPGSFFSNCIHLLHRREDIYPQPEAFRPERFLERKFSPYEWTPFGGGVRRCIGMAFALHEMKAMLATILSRTRLQLADANVRAVRHGAFMFPEHGLRLRVIERRQPRTTPRQARTA